MFPRGATRAAQWQMCADVCVEEVCWVMRRCTADAPPNTLQAAVCGQPLLQSGVSDQPTAAPITPITLNTERLQHTATIPPEFIPQLLLLLTETTYCAPVAPVVPVADGEREDFR